MKRKVLSKRVTNEMQCLCRSRMPPPVVPKPKAKSQLKRSNASDPIPSTPTTSAPGTPQTEIEEQPKPKRAKRTPKEQAPLTPLAKGKDTAVKVLKKKGAASEMALTLQNVQFAEQLREEMTRFAGLFECLSLHLCGFAVCYDLRKLYLGLNSLTSQGKNEAGCCGSFAFADAGSGLSAICEELLGCGEGL